MQARDVMTSKVVTVDEDARVGKAIALMKASHVSGLPVVDAGGALTGILTEGDLLRRVETGTGTPQRGAFLNLILGSVQTAGEYVRTHSRRVGDLMTRDVASVAEDTPLPVVIEMMERRNIRRVPVLQDGRIVGIVSRSDMVYALGHALEAAAGGHPSDAAIRERLTADLRNQDWAPTQDVNITVRDGVVTLEGIIASEQERTALRVAAENVDGVARVEDRLSVVDRAAAGIMF